MSEKRGNRRHMYIRDSKASVAPLIKKGPPGPRVIIVTAWPKGTSGNPALKKHMDLGKGNDYESLWGHRARANYREVQALLAFIIALTPGLRETNPRS